ncbi:hypothetical protein NQ317_013426 [Molorchus minor]|uniref:Uncharacterized protein n=1 Tax=Molorchus minor TaxID=1323400 RepID=A0ABQ9JTI1_9CUCU|nr:hypothetical protein NQ317_013426 [Molorchus minor]
MQINGKLGRLMESCGKVSDAIWSQIATVVKQYVQRTDPNRIHLEDMRRSDAESAAEITDNEERIRKKEELIYSLRKDHDNLCLNRGKKIKVLEKELGVIKVEVIKSKQQLKRQLQIDEKKLKHISNCSSQTNICERFQTQREITAKWLPLISNVYLKDNVTDQTDLRELQAVIDSSDVAKDIELSMLEKPKTDVKGRTRPKTSVPGRPSKPGKTVSQTSTPDSKKITKLRKVHLEEKDSSEKAPLSSVSTLSTTASPDILDRCLESLRGMENFWFTFNKVEVDYMEIKEEKKLLENENKQLKGLARAVLESASLAESIPNRSVSSKSRMAKSAPIRRVVRALF